MTTIELTRAILRRLVKFRLLILVFGLALGSLLLYYAMSSPVLYTAKATVFPLNSGQENNNASNIASMLGLGGGEGGKSFSDDASINIVALANSRTTREAVAAKHIPSLGNKSVAQLLMADANENLGWFDEKVQRITDQDELLIWASSVLKTGLSANIDKMGILNISFTNKSPELVQVITESFIETISQFYIDLKREKAKRDYTFAAAKVDSLYRMMHHKDVQLVQMDRTTLFTDKSRLEFQVPMENKITEKAMIRSQYTQAVTNRENSAYRLQKATPVIKVLDRPAAPYDIQKKSLIIYGTIGFLFGVALMIFLLLAGLLWKYINQEASKAILGNTVVKENGVLVSAN